MPKILVSSDSFKGSLSSKQIGDIFDAVSKEYKDVEITTIPIADGGEGTLDAIYSTGKYSFKEVECFNPLFSKIKAKYLTSKTTAVIEMAQASGLTLIPYKDGRIRQNDQTAVFVNGDVYRSIPFRLETIQKIRDCIVTVGECLIDT